MAEQNLPDRRNEGTEMRGSGSASQDSVISHHWMAAARNAAELLDAGFIFPQAA